jgi:transcriptional regulator with XRE-family HTH domain
LLEHLNKRGKSQVDLAIHLDVSRSYINQVIKGDAHLSVYNMRKVAKFLHCKMDDLIEWDVDLK